MFRIYIKGDVHAMSLCSHSVPREEFSRFSESQHAAIYILKIRLTHSVKSLSCLVSNKRGINKEAAVESKREREGVRFLAHHNSLFTSEKSSAAPGISTLISQLIGVERRNCIPGAGEISEPCGQKNTLSKLIIPRFTYLLGVFFSVNFAEIIKLTWNIILARLLVLQFAVPHSKH